jgi:crossover junction endodeoxyribonuclease RuvC
MIILGIDPGTTTTGFGLIEHINSKLEILDFGIIETKPKIPLPEKLSEIYKDIKKIIKNSKPDKIAIEQLFFLKNTKTAMAVGQARGIILLAAQDLKIPIHEFTPLQVKSSICGNGHADKLQVQKMVKAILKLKEIPKPDDAADALALAICCVNNMEKFLKESC